MNLNHITALVAITLLQCTVCFAEENNNKLPTNENNFEFPPGTHPYSKELQLELNKKNNNAAVPTSLALSIYLIVAWQNTLTDCFWNLVHTFFNMHITL